MASHARPASDASDTLDVEKLWRRLRTSVRNIVALPEVDSTHAMGIRLVDSFAADEEAALEPTLILAGSQTAGQGRDGRTWQSPVGGLYLTWLRSGLSSSLLQLLPVCTAVAGLDALAASGIDGAAVKWPNDLLVDGHKVGGCLVHVRSGAATWVVVSIGINLTSQPELNDSPAYPPTSVETQLSGTHGSLDLGRTIPSAVRAFADSLHDALVDPTRSLTRWRQALVHRVGETITIRRSRASTISGTFLGTTEQGILRVRHNDEELQIAAGDVIDRSTV